MKKIIAIIISFFLLVFAFLFGFTKSTDALVKGTPFPFEEYGEYYLYLGSGAFAINESVIDGVTYAWGHSITASVNKYRRDEVDSATFDSGIIAQQQGDLDIKEVTGIPLEDESNNNPYVSECSYNGLCYGDSVNLGWNSDASTKKMLESWNTQAAKPFASNYQGTNEVTEYLGGWLYTYDYERLDYNNEPYQRFATFKALIPVNDLPGAYMYFIFRVGIKDYDSSKASSFNSVCNLKDSLFKTDYLLTWKDDLYIAGENQNPTNNPEQNQNGENTQNATDNPGEDKGTLIPVAIVVGLGGALAAIIGASVANSSSTNALDEEKRRKSYKMYVQKDFGDSIRKGAKQPSIVRARMAEIDELGKEHDRDDLTKNITASSNEMEIVSTKLNGRYLEATVKVPANYESDRATLTFTFTGEGGTFTNNIIFRVVDGPELQFILVGEGKGTYSENCGINAIEGDGFTYDATFEIVNATTPPKKENITSTQNSKFEVEFEETDKPSVFKMLVKNKSVPEDEDNVFTNIKKEKFEINVKLEDEEKPLTGYVIVDLYQEGITFASSDKGEKNGTKYIQIQAYEKDSYSGLDGAWQATEIKITLAIKGKDNVIINPKEAEYEFDKLQATGIGSSEEVERSIAGKYEYEEDFDKNNYNEPRYHFEPKSHLCEPEDGTFFMVYLPVKASYDGQNYENNMPLRLRGKDPDPMEKEWQKEYDKLKERIQKYSTPENKSKWEEKLNSLVGEAKPSVEELRLTSKYVVMQYMRYWTIEAEKHLDEAKMYDKIVDYLEWIKFFGDCAFSYIITAYAGTAAPVVEAIVSPVKDFTVEAAGELIAAKIRGQSIEFDKFDFVKVALEAGDNIISGNISFTDWRKAASTLGMYFAYATLKNFYINLVENDKCDLYGALIAGFKDLTKNALKAMAGKVFDAVLKHFASSRKKIRIKIGQFITEHLGAGKTFDLRDMGDLTRAGYLRKLLDELFGKGVEELLLNPAKEIHDNFIDSDTDIGLNENNELVVKLDFYAFEERYTVGINLTKIFLYATAPVAPVTFFMYLYDQYFGKVPSANSLIEKPNDPPLPKS